MPAAEAARASAVYYSAEHLALATPSRRDGIEAGREAYLRRKYCEFLTHVAHKLKLPRLPLATAMVFCHRFYAQHSHALPENERHLVAAACLFLACKVEETPKDLQNVVEVTYRAQHSADMDAQTIKHNLASQEVLETEYARINITERRVLHTINFEVDVHHPYLFVFKVLKELCNTGEVVPQMDKVSGSLIEHSIRTTLCLQYDPATIGCALMWLTALKLAAPFARPANFALYMAAWKRVCSYPAQQEAVSAAVFADVERQISEVKAPHVPAAAAGAGGHQQQHGGHAGGGGGSSPAGTAQQQQQQHARGVAHAGQPRASPSTSVLSGQSAGGGGGPGATPSPLAPLQPSPQAPSGDSSQLRPQQPQPAAPQQQLHGASRLGPGGGASQQQQQQQQQQPAAAAAAQGEAPVEDGEGGGAASSRKRSWASAAAVAEGEQAKKARRDAAGAEEAAEGANAAAAAAVAAH